LRKPQKKEEEETEEVLGHLLSWEYSVFSIRCLPRPSVCLTFPAKIHDKLLHNTCNLDAQQPELVRKFLLYQVTVQWLECLGTQGSGAPAPLIIGKQRFRA